MSALALQVPDELVEAIARRVVALLREDAPSPPDARELLTVEEAAAHLRCKPRRIYDLTSHGRLPVVKDGARSLYRREDLDAYLSGGTP